MQFLKRFGIGIIVLALFSVFVIKTGNMPAVIDFASTVFGQKGGDVVRDFSETSKDIVEGDRDLPDLPEWEGDSLFSVADAREMLTDLGTTRNERIPDYDRKKFGKSWADVDDNQCDTRNDILARDLTKVKKEGNCIVVSGSLLDPYTGKNTTFTKDSSGGGLDIEHVGALGWAWENGAWKWSDEQRLLYANDPIHLFAVSASENRAKGDKGPSEWLVPNNAAFRCDYAKTYIAITTKYSLTLSDADRSALSAALGTCKS